MLQVGSFVLWHEFKYRSLCIAVSIVTSIILQFIYIDSILLYPIHLVFFLHYYMHFNYCTSSLYYNSFHCNTSKLASFNFDNPYIFFYPEVEYTNNILDSYYIFYIVFFVLLVILLLPLVFYQVYIYIRPAMYPHEINFLNKASLYILCSINLSIIVSFKEFIFFINNLTYNSYNYMEIHINYDLLQLFSYFILLLLFNIIYLFILIILLFRFTLHYFLRILGSLILCYILYHSIIILPYYYCICLVYKSKERMGFEPTMPLRHNTLAKYRFRPLSHLSFFFIYLFNTFLLLN